LNKILNIKFPPGGEFPPVENPCRKRKKGRVIKFYIWRASFPPRSELKRFFQKQKNAFCVLNSNAVEVRSTLDKRETSK